MKVEFKVEEQLLESGSTLLSALLIAFCTPHDAWGVQDDGAGLHMRRTVLIW